MNAQFLGKLRALQTKAQFMELSPGFAACENEIVSELFSENQQIMDDFNQEWLKVRKAQQ